MKKLLSIMLALCLCLTVTLVFTACEDAGGTDETTTAAGEGDGTTAEEAPPSPILLRADAAEVTSDGSAEQLHVEENGNLGYWKAGNSAKWAITVPKDGKYKVTLNYAKGTTQDAECVVTVGDKTLANRIAVTGAWETYVDFELGTIDLTTADTALTVAPGDMPETDFMNLITLTLTYAE